MDNTRSCYGPLNGLNVIDLGHYYAGPMVGMMLADQGATVIRVVSPKCVKGDRSEDVKYEIPEQQFRLLNRNKNLLTLDLKKVSGREKVFELVKKADILIENFRPGVMKRLGLSYGDIKQHNPRLIFLSLPGFSSHDKERAFLRGWEGILGAASCCYTQLHLFRQTLDFPPVYTAVPQCSTYGAVNGATAVMAALLGRCRFGQGTFIEVPLINSGAQAVAQTFSGLGDNGFPEPPTALVYSENDSKPQQLDKLELAGENLGLASKMYLCRDGRYIYISTYLSNSFIKRFLKTIGIFTQVLSEGFVCEGPWQRDLDNDVGNCATLSREKEERLLELISEKMLTKSSWHWEQYLSAFNIPAVVVRTREEYFEIEALLASGVLVELGAGDDTLIVPGRLGDVSIDDSMVSGYRDAKNVSFDKALESFNQNSIPSDIAPKKSTLSKADLLQGVKVLDLCNVIAGPTAGHVLAEYGADVVKFDSPDGIHPMFLPLNLELNQGKRSILIDIKTASGREVFHRLIKWADLVLHNVLDETAQRMGVTQEQLKAINPHIVCCQLSANGGTQRGAWENRPSFDNLVQGLNGLLAQYGTVEQPMWHGAISSADTIGGIGMAFCSLLALYQRSERGIVSEVRTSLLRATNHYQLPTMISTNGVFAKSYAKGQFSLGESWWQRMYRCQDGWVFVSLPYPERHRLLETVLGKEMNEYDSCPEKELEEAFEASTLTHWLELNKVSVSCHPVVNSIDLQRDLLVRDVGNDAADELDYGLPEILKWSNHPAGCDVHKLKMETVMVGESRITRRMSVAPCYGKDTATILESLGYSSEELKQMEHNGVAFSRLRSIGSKNAYFLYHSGRE